MWHWLGYYWSLTDNTSGESSALGDSGLWSHANWMWVTETAESETVNGGGGRGEGDSCILFNKSKLIVP